MLILNIKKEQANIVKMLYAVKNLVAFLNVSAIKRVNMENTHVIFLTLLLKNNFNGYNKMRNSISFYGPETPWVMM